MTPENVFAAAKKCEEYLFALYGSTDDMIIEGFVSDNEAVTQITLGFFVDDEHKLKTLKIKDGKVVAIMHIEE